MWCGGIVFFDRDRMKQEIITFAHGDVCAILVSIINEAIDHQQINVYLLLTCLCPKIAQQQSSNWTRLSQAEKTQLLETAKAALDASEDPVALLTSWFSRDEHFRRYGNTAQEALKGWSFFVHDTFAD